VLKKVKPVTIVAPHPQLDTHRDHQFTSVALAEALRRWNNRVTLLLYTNHADQNRYPYGPAGTLMSLPPPPARPAEIALDRVYSHPVPPELQRLKLFALESMHDLRFNPTRQISSPKATIAIALGEAGPRAGHHLPAPRAAIERAVLRLRPRYLPLDDRRVPRRARALSGTRCQISGSVIQTQD
jgi:hypothetical protein